MRTKYKDEHYFDQINTEEKAYWLGFLWADGNISKPKRLVKGEEKPFYRIEVSLKYEDHEHLERFKKALNAETEVKKSHTNFPQSERCRFSFNSKHMWETLNSYGCTPRKSLTLMFPNANIFENKSLIKHFIRGYVDGDGCLSFTNTNHTKAILSILGTENVLTNLQHWLPLEFENELYGKKDENSNVKVLAFNGHRAYYVARYLYKDCNVCLKRKYDRYIEYCRLYEESYGLRLGKYGELWNENAVVNSETKKSESPYSVEGEPVEQNIILPRVSDTPTEISG